MTTQCERRPGVQREVIVKEPATLFIQVYCLMIALAIGLSAVIFFGGDARFSSPTFAGPRNLVEWSSINPRLVWGTVFLVLGVTLVLSVHQMRAVRVLRVGLVVYAFLTVTFLWSAVAAPTAVLTGVVAYSIFGTTHLLLSAHLQRYGWR